VNKQVLDASAVLALILDEAPLLSPLFSPKDTVISAVNLTEVLTRVIDLKGSVSALVPRITQIVSEVIPFTEAGALSAAMLRQATRHLGLSLGDRACLALAIELNADVYTADRAWKELALPCTVHVIR
jgi:ribonuclease VapC